MSVYVHIQGHDLFETVTMPEAPRKGDVLWLGSLTRGRAEGNVIVSKVEWGMEQISGVIEVWLTVRRLPPPSPASQGEER